MRGLDGSAGATNSAPAHRSPRNQQPIRTHSRGVQQDEDAGYGGDQERGTNGPREATIQRRRSLVDTSNSPATIRQRISRGGTYVPIDPALLQEDQEIVGQRTQRLETRLIALEAQIRGAEVGAAARGPAPADGDDSAGEAENISEVYCPDPDAVKDDSDPLSIVTTQYKDNLSTMQRKALSRCQAAVQGAFREVTGVLTAKDPWPKWTSNDDWTGPGMAVHFGGTVKHPVNRNLFRRVAAVAMQDLKKDSAMHANWMNAPDVKLTIGLLVEITKGTFRGFKTPFLKSKNYRSAIPAYLEAYGGADPSELVLPDWMSDEASGPEDIEAESIIDWKRRMAEKDGHVGIAEDILQKKMYLETVKPKWRSDALSEIYHRLRKIWYDSLSVRFANAMTTRISTSNRSTNTPPPFAPYNFGINQQWLEEYKNDATYKIALRTWGTFTDPPGFGAAVDAGEPPGVAADAGGELPGAPADEG
ncbi:hypothetical protein C2E23DRAFT_880265 [Lenzites betulinus]|nr:hypothetical protein C2E23DRAFT_880265 [Lenzites betulinus]